MTGDPDRKVLFTAIRVGDNGYAEREPAFCGAFFTEVYFAKHMFIPNAVEGVTYEVRTSSGSAAESRYLADWTVFDGEIVWSRRKWLR